MFLTNTVNNRIHNSFGSFSFVKLDFFTAFAQPRHMDKQWYIRRRSLSIKKRHDYFGRGDIALQPGNYLQWLKIQS